MRLFVPDGTIPANDEIRFTQGACFILADVINALTGWPIYTSGEPRWHVFNRVTEDLFFDVRGFQTPAEMHDQWGQSFYELDNHELFNWHSPFDYADSYERATIVARELLHRRNRSE